MIEPGSRVAPAPFFKALTVRQPWASLIAHGVKQVETRTRPTNHRGPLAIHAGLHRPVEGAEDGGWWWQWDVDHGIIVNQNAHPRREEFPAPLGAIVAVADLVDCIPITTHASIGDPECVVAHDDGTIDHAIPATPPPPGPTNVVRLDEPDIPDGVHLIRDISAQAPYGDFTPGRWAWILQDVRPLPEPIPCRGAQGLWTVPATAVDLLTATAGSGS